MYDAGELFPGFLLPVHRVVLMIDAKMVSELVRFLNSNQDSEPDQAISHVIRICPSTAQQQGPRELWSPTPGSSAKRKLQTPRRLKVKGNGNRRQFCNCQSHREPQDSTDFHYRLLTISISIT